MSENYQPVIAQMIAHVTTKASVDEAFRAALLENPRAAAEKEFGSALPPQVTIEAVALAPNTVLIPVPHMAVASEDGELSDDDLETVAGGSKSEAKKFFNGVGSGIGMAAGAAVLVGTLNVKPMGAVHDLCF